MCSCLSLSRWVAGALGREAEEFLRECTAVAEWKNQGVGDLAHWSSMTWGGHWRQGIGVEIARGVARCVERAATGAPRVAVESQEEATADLAHIRTILTRRWGELRDSQLDRAAMDQLLYIATVFGVGVDDAFAPLRTDWWRASYLNGGATR